MKTLLLRGAEVLVTMDAERREIPDGGVFVEDGIITRVGTSRELPPTADEIVDVSGHVVVPGLINTHHHFTQTLTRAMAQDSELFGWLTELYPVWSGITPEHVKVSTTTALGELALSGCTTAFDHTYLWANGCRLDDQFEGAEPVGVRLVASRGSMSLGESDGGLPPDSVVESEDDILEDTARVIAAFHDPNPGSMSQVVVAPCSPFSVTPELMTRSADLAREMGVRLHTHLCETRDEESYCLEHFGMRPFDYAESLGWTGADVWFAHAVWVSDDDIASMARSLTGAAHCPSSNMRLSSGIAPVSRFLDAGVPVGLGVDGSASNDSSHLLAEVRQALLSARALRALEAPDTPMLTARAVLEVATLGGASVLGRSDIGAIEQGRVADLACFSLADPTMAGVADPVAGLILSGSLRASRLFVGGKAVVEEGRLTGLDLERQIEDHQRLSRQLLGGGRR